MTTIVVSAVNLNVGGTLTILRDCLQYLSIYAAQANCRVVALVYKKELAFYPHIEYIEIQWPKKLWPLRLWCEYVTMHSLSKRLAPVSLWLSLHDTTPNVVAERRAVYCHNPFPFYQGKMREWLFSPKIMLFSLLSKYAYQINIHQNDYIVVQQEWIRREFTKMFGLDTKKIIVTPPEYTPTEQKATKSQITTDGYSFIYAASPNSHKNFECLCEAAKILKEEMPENKFTVYITVKGDENHYAQWLHKHWGQSGLPIKFIGFQKREDLYAYYQQCNCLVFPSKVETWGLPITEFASFHKPMLLADLPYAHETAKGCNQVAFFHADKPAELSNEMKKLTQGNTSFLISVSKREKEAPTAASWEELFRILLTEQK
jgi:glycosyltransferase involved in cell wall biosynthesis